MLLLRSVAAFSLAVLSVGCVPSGDLVERDTTNDGAGGADALSEQWHVARDIDMVRDLDPGLIFAVGAPSDWRPDTGSLLDEQLPVPWPERYVDEYGQNFNPSTYKKNASLLCAFAEAHPEKADDVESIAEALFQRMLEYTVLQGHARFIVYDFEHSYEGHALDRGWPSGLGNGHAIAGTMALRECWPRDDYLDAAYELARAYEVTSQDGLWFASVTDEGLLWFEEVAVSSEPQMILNGHVSALIGLYYLWDQGGGDAGVLRTLRAGVSAVRHYVHQYRRPGEVNCYDLSPPCHDDYSPERAVWHQHVLWQMTRDEYFRKMRDRFAEDMSVDVEGFGATP